ncbi:hypothetical protein NS07_v2contig00114-0003 [Nocardia seriolae]|nr:hypothetical protein NS07_v2contig00114-0003 [Nocardia seriolae]
MEQTGRPASNPPGGPETAWAGVGVAPVGPDDGSDRMSDRRARAESDVAENAPVSWDHLKSRRPSDAERAALQKLLIERGRAVRQQGWDAYRGAWSDGEVAVIAYLLDDTELLEELDEPEGSVLTRLAGELYGFNAARKEIESGLTGTQAWVAETRKKLGS